MPNPESNLKYTAEVSKKEIEDTIASIRVISSIGFAQKAFDIEGMRKRILEYLRQQIPLSPASKRQHRHFDPHIRTGFRSYLIPQMADKLGFLLQHQGILRDARLRTVLISLDKGSKAYVRKPAGLTWVAKSGPNKGKVVGQFSFRPGDGRGDRHQTMFPPGPDYAIVPELKYPARPGLNFIKRTYEYAQRQVASRKPKYFQEIAKTFGKKRK